MSNTYNDDAIEDCVWSVIEASQNVADHITYLRHFLSSVRHRDQALDKVASLFSPGFSYFESAYLSAFEAVETLTGAAGTVEQRRNAWFNLGKMLHNGYGIGADPARAAGVYEQAIELGEIRSLINLGALYEAGKGVERSIERAQALFEKAIDLGESLGYMRLSELLPQDASKERGELLRRGAELDCPFASLRLGKLFINGKEGFEKDPEQGMYWIERSANAGNGYGAFHMGWHYENGHSVAKNLELAIKWYDEGIARGDRASMSALGVLLYYGMGIEENYERSMYLLKRAAVLGDPIAQRRYGRELIWGPLNSATEEGIKREGVAWLSLAEENDDDRAAELLGRVYRKGIGVEVDHKKSSSYLLKAAKGGIPEAQGQIGLNFWYGIGLEVNYEEAYKWLSICALQGQAEGVYYLARATEQGIGCEVNFEEAIKLYQRSAELGDPDAVYALGECAYYGRGQEADPRIAVMHYQKAANKGHTAAMVRLGVMLYDGEHVLTNYEEAARWFSEAAHQDDPRGMY